MAVGTYNYTWEQGADLPVQLIYNEGETPTPVDLSTNYAVRMDLRLANVTGALKFTFNSIDIEELDPDDTDLEITLGTLGEINIMVPRSLTLTGGALYTDIVTGNNIFYYDIFLRKISTDTQIKLVQGTITVNRSATLWLETEV